MGNVSVPCTMLPPPCWSSLRAPSTKMCLLEGRGQGEAELEVVSGKPHGSCQALRQASALGGQPHPAASWRPSAATAPCCATSASGLAIGCAQMQKQAGFMCSYPWQWANGLQISFTWGQVSGLVIDLQGLCAP